MTGKVLVRAALVLLVAMLLPARATAQATIVLLNADFPGEGFNEPTPTAPVGGNPGTTVGEQRLIAVQFAAQRWAETLTSPIPIRVIAFFDELACTPTSAALAGAAPFRSLANAPTATGAPGLTPNTFYPVALAEKLSELALSDLFFPGNPFHVFAIFNIDLGEPGCFDGGGWYYGLDGNAPGPQSSLATVALHEFGHGLGFTVGPTNADTGVRAGALQFPSVWESQMWDLTLGKTWLEMTNAERALSARNTSNLVWQGAAAASAAPGVLGRGIELVLNGPASVAGRYQAEAATFGTRVSSFRDVLMPARDAGGVFADDGCEPFTSNVRGRIALVNRGTCTFVQKAVNAQSAGATALVIANNAPGPFVPGGTEPAVRIPVVGITQALGNAMRGLPQLSNPGGSGLPTTIQESTVFLAGVSGSYPRLYAPSVFQPGSSVSHWDTTLSPNQLMEPFINPGLTFQLVPPADLTFPLLQDIGW